MRVRDFLLSLVMLASVMVVPACNANTSSEDEQDFSGNTVIVIMTKEAGGVNKHHDKETFGTIASQIVNIVDLTYKNDPDNANINERWRQILLLTLNRDSKKNVLKVIDYLNQLDVVHFAEPNYHDGP